MGAARVEEHEGDDGGRQSMTRKLQLMCILLAVSMAFPGLAAASFTKESAMQAISDAESIIKEMQEMKLGVTYANDTLNEAKVLFLQERYMTAETMAGKIAEIKATAIKISGLADAAEARLYDLSLKGYDVGAAQSLFSSGLEEFRIGNYKEAENKINSVISLLDETEARESVKKTGASGTDPWSVLLDNLWLIIAASLATLISGFRAKKISEKRKAKKRAKTLENEKNKLTIKLKGMQKDYFGEGVMPKADYEILLDKYTERLDSIKKELSSLKERPP
jgi:cellobiose-specific phosphotransferase system component IIA